MLDLPGAVDVAGLFLALVGAAAFIVAYFRSSYTKNTIQQLQDLSEALDKRVAALEEERTILTEKIENLEQENEVLRGLVNGETQFDALLRIIDKNHQEVMVALGVSINKKG